MTEFRLRLDCIDLALPVFAMTENISLQRVTESRELAPRSVGGYYDRPIPRRIAEEAGIARGTFATVKHAATSLLHQQGAAAFAPASVASIAAFAAAEGAPVPLVARPRLTRFDRGLLHAARTLHVRPIARRLAERQHSLIHHEPRAGALLFRWGVAKTRSRYESLRPAR